jgi:sucrose phosphorylase
MLITETNVPHADNLSYFGDGTNEAQLVYNFALPPLSLHALLRGDSTRLTRWAQTLTLPSDRVTLFNFLASHDGIGLNPARGILPDQEIDFLVERCQAHGGFISYKNNPDGAQTPYEMNTTWFDALNDPRTEEPLLAQANRFLVSQAIMLALQGVPGIYFHSLFGSRNDRSAALATGVNRRINRQKFDRSNLETRLADRSSLEHMVFSRFRDLLRLRRLSPAFHPGGRQEVIACDPRIFVVVRTSPDGRRCALCLHNVSADEVRVTIPLPADGRRIFAENSVGADGLVQQTVLPYGVRWIFSDGTVRPPLTTEPFP